MTVVFWSALGMLAGQMLRTLPLLAQTAPAGWHWLRSGASVHWFPAAPLFGFVVGGTVMLFVAGEATRRKSCGYFLTGCLWAGILAFFTGLIGDQLLISGDQALQPAMQFITHNWAAGAWMFVGGVLGACYGTLRRVRDIFSPRLLYVLGGWAVAVTLLYFVIAVVQVIVPEYG